MSLPPSERSQARLDAAHLRRLSDLAEQDHEYFTRDDGRPEYRNRRLLVALGQGAALHYLDRRTGIKDLDLWTFYAAVPGRRFPADKRETHADFGESDLGRQRYDLDAARNQRERSRFQTWQNYSGRRVDFMLRSLPVPPDAVIEDAVAAVQRWLAQGAATNARHKPTPWHLAKKAMILVWPHERAGDQLWPRP
ncbi:hypothetical protein GCM10012284_54460 [Mangrovihabitans endophyticus]|uniref:Uncharacterized protein n=1 Tax=Mangrovihabitans endophyticus TaxID=1751298 RepID=A0A8J3C3M3_9ACTN|nr:hypothetical protein GCM10012284_54460 [Mangrovihabitans endophyticus]